MPVEVILDHLAIPITDHSVSAHRFDRRLPKGIAITKDQKTI